MDNRKEVKVIHPDYGHVIFHGPTPRQVDILNSVKASRNLVDDIIAQNKMLSDIILDRDQEIDGLKKEIAKLKQSGESPYIDFLN